MTADPVLSAWEYTARAFEPNSRRYPAPGDLARRLDAKTASSPSLDLIDRELVDLVDGHPDHNALAVFMPPQEGKSQRVSRRFPEWLLEHDQSLRIAIVSYEQDMALRWGRDVRQDITLAGTALPISVRRDSNAAGRWETPAGGGIYCVGIGGPLTGRPVDVLIIDDPVKDRAAAESPKIRESTWDWWESVALTRLAPGGRVVLIQTRWHEDDLAGRIMSRPSPLIWKVLTMPAIAGDRDPLGRQAGEELTSVRARAPGHFYNLRRGLSPYVFSGVYQQSPTAPEGNFFRRATFRYWRQAPAWNDGRERIDCEGQPVTLADCWRFATVDVAASTKTSADWTVVAVWGMSVAGDLILLDRRRERVAMHDHFSLIEPLRDRWRFDQVYVERQFYASTLVSDARDHGVPIAEVVADSDKVTRAIPAAGRVHAGRVWFPAETSGCPCGNCPGGVWLDEWCDELASFPQGAHDDQVDVLAYAARIAVAEWTPAAPPARPGVGDHEYAMSQAQSAATGNGDHPLDIMGMTY
jgi:predicted phage terminase large subunit-like protein